MDKQHMSNEPEVPSDLIFNLIREKEENRKAYWESFYKKYENRNDEDDNGVIISRLIAPSNSHPTMNTIVEPSSPRSKRSCTLVVNVQQKQRSVRRRTESSVSSLPDSATSKEDDVRRWIEINQQQFSEDASTAKNGRGDEPELPSEEPRPVVNADPESVNIIDQEGEVNSLPTAVTNNQAVDVIDFDSNDDSPDEQPAKKQAGCVFLDKFNVEYFRNLGMEWKPSANALIKSAEDYKKELEDKTDDNEKDISECIEVVYSRRRSNKSSRKDTDLPLDAGSLPIVRPHCSTRRRIDETYVLSQAEPQGTLVGLNKVLMKEGQLDKSFPMGSYSKIPIVVIDSTETDNYLKQKQEEFERDAQCIEVEDNNSRSSNTVSKKTESIKTDKKRVRENVPFQTPKTNIDKASNHRDIEIEILESVLPKKDKSNSTPLKKVTFASEEDSSSKILEMEVRGVSLPKRRSSRLSKDSDVVLSPLQVPDEPGETVGTPSRMRLSSESTSKQKLRKKSFGDEIEIIKEVEQKTKQNVCPLRAQPLADMTESTTSSRNSGRHASLGGRKFSETSSPRVHEPEPKMLRCLRYAQDPLFKARRSSLTKATVVSNQSSVQSKLCFEKTESRITRGKSLTINEDGKNERDIFESLAEVEEVLVTSPKGKSKRASGDRVVALPHQEVGNKPAETMSKRIVKTRLASIEGESDSKSRRTSGNEIEIVREVKQVGETDDDIVESHVRRLFTDSSLPVDSPQVLNNRKKSVPPKSAGGSVRRPSFTRKSNVNNIEMENHVKRARNILTENPAVNTIINLYAPTNESSSVAVRSDRKQSELLEEDFSTDQPVIRNRFGKSLVDTHSDGKTAHDDSVRVLDIVVPSDSSDSGSLIFERKRCGNVRRPFATRRKFPTVPPNNIEKVSKANHHSKSTSNTSINENVVVSKSGLIYNRPKAKMGHSSDRKVRNDVLLVESDMSDDGYADQSAQCNQMKSHQRRVRNSKRFHSSSEEVIVNLDGNGNQLSKDRLSVKDKNRNTETMSRAHEIKKRLSMALEKQKLLKRRNVYLSSSSSDEHDIFLDNDTGRNVGLLIRKTLRCSPRKSNSKEPTNGELILEEQNEGRISFLETSGKKNIRKEEVKNVGKERQRSNKREDKRVAPKEDTSRPQRQTLNVQDDARIKTKRQRDSRRSKDYVPVPESESDAEVSIVRDVENTGRRSHKAKGNTSPYRSMVQEGSSSATSGDFSWNTTASNVTCEDFRNTSGSKSAVERSKREDHARVVLDEPVIVSDSDVECW